MNKKTTVALLTPFLLSCGTYHEDGDPTKPEINPVSRGAEVVIETGGHIAKKAGEGIDHLSTPEGKKDVADLAEKTATGVISVVDASAEGIKNAWEKWQAKKNASENPDLDITNP